MLCLISLLGFSSRLNPSFWPPDTHNQNGTEHLADFYSFAFSSQSEHCQLTLLPLLNLCDYFLSLWLPVYSVYLFFFYLWVYTHTHTHTHTHTLTRASQKRSLDSLEPESQVVMSHLTWVLDTELWASGRGARYPLRHLSSPTEWSVYLCNFGGLGVSLA
jgi:hypothetical protein